MENYIKRLVIEPLERFYDNVLQYLPNVISFLLILVAGLIMGRLLKVLFSYVFRFIKIDKFSDRSGIQGILGKGGIRENLSIVLSRLVGWVTVFVFIIIALDVLEVPEVEHLLRTFFLYLPNVFVSVIILLSGYLLGNFLGRAALITAVNSDIKKPGVIGKLVKFGIYVTAATMSLEQLGIGRETIIIAFTIIFGGAVFALSLALGLGGKDMAREYLDRALRGKKEETKKEDDIHHL
jgi:hypothetical protein